MKNLIALPTFDFDLRGQLSVLENSGRQISVWGIRPLFILKPSIKTLAEIPPALEGKSALYKP